MFSWTGIRWVIWDAKRSGYKTIVDPDMHKLMTRADKAKHHLYTWGTLVFSAGPVGSLLGRACARRLGKLSGKYGGSTKSYRRVLIVDGKRIY